MSISSQEPSRKRADFETQDCSPAIRTRYKIQNPQYSKPSKPSPVKDDDLRKAFEGSPHRKTQPNHKEIVLSETEKKMYQHSLVASIMERSRAKTVKHSIGQISPQTKLYASPIKMPKQEISTKAGPYASQCSRKVVSQIYDRLNDRKSFTQKMQSAISSHRQSQEKSTLKVKARPRSASQNTNLNKRVSVSGLVTYNFNSINAKKSLGYNPSHDNEEKLRQELHALKRKNACMISRGEAIAKRRSVKVVLQKEEFKKAAVSDFDTPTGPFLSILKYQHQKNQQIYGQKLSKLKCIQEYMEQEGVSYEQAEEIVNEIAEASKVPPQPKPHPPKYLIDEETELRAKKKILQSKRVMLRHLYFVE